MQQAKKLLPVAPAKAIHIIHLQLPCEGTLDSSRVFLRYIKGNSECRRQGPFLAECLTSAPFFGILIMTPTDGEERLKQGDFN